MSTVTHYFRTGPMTEDKLDWIENQINSLQKANRELGIRINRDTVNFTVNEQQIAVMKTILERCAR